MAQLFANNAYSALVGSLSDSATLLNLAAGSGNKFPSPTNGDYFLLTLADVSGGTESAWEIVKVTARTADALTIVRAQEGTTARAWAAGTPVDLRITAASFVGKESTDNKGVANGYAGLDAAGKVPANQLPSYVDDVLEYANLAAFPVTGEDGKIYVALNTNKTYRWSGSAYVYITSGAVDSVAGKTGVVSLVKGDVGLGDVDNTSDATKNSASATLTNKTISVDSNTISGLAESSFALTNASGNLDGLAAAKAVPAGVVVGTTDTQTLTNKTLTSPVLTTPTLGTPSSGTLTSCTGLPIVGGTTGTLTVGRGGTGATTLTGIVKGNGTGAMTAAVAGTDFVSPATASNFTAPQRSALLTDNEGSFDLAAKQNFKCTTAGAVTLTFTNQSDGLSGSVIFVNASNHTVSAHANTKLTASDLAKLSVTGTYRIDYLSDGTNAYCSVIGSY